MTDNSLVMWLLGVVLLALLFGACVPRAEVSRQVAQARAGAFWDGAATCGDDADDPIMAMGRRRRHPGEPVRNAR